MRGAAARALRRLPRRAAAARARRLRPLRRADRVAGRALPRVRGRRIAFASARAAVLRRPRRTVARGGWKERGLRRLAAARRPSSSCEVAAAAARRRRSPSSRADGDRMLSRGHHPADAAGARAGARAGGSRSALPRRARRVSQAARALADASAGGTSPARSVRARDSPRRLCLVDDVYTTGSTVSAAASALRGAARGTSTSSRSPAPCASSLDWRQRRRHPTRRRNATSGEGQERRGQRLDPRVRRGEARASSSGSWPIRRGSSWSSRSSRTRRSRQSHVAEATIWTKGPILRARESATRHEGLDRPARRQARAAGEALPREAAPDAARRAQRRPPEAVMPACGPERDEPR